MKRPSRPIKMLKNLQEKNVGMIDLNGADGLPQREGGVVFEGDFPDMRTRTRKRCEFRVVSRHTVHEPMIQVSAFQYDCSSQAFHSTETEKMVQEVKIVLEQKLSTEISYGDFGASSSLTGSALEEHLREHIRQGTITVVRHEVKVSGTMTITVRSTVTETWAWDGEDCPPDLGGPWFITYIRMGPTQTYSFEYDFVEWEKKATSEWLGGEPWAKGKARAHVASLINKGAWIPTDLPISDTLPTPHNF